MTATTLLVTIPEAARLLSVSTRTVRRLIDRGEIKTTRIGRSVRIAYTVLDAVAHAPMIAQSYTEAKSTDNTGRRTCGNVIRMDSIKGRAHPSGGLRSQINTGAEKALDDLLRSRSSKTRKV